MWLMQESLYFSLFIIIVQVRNGLSVGDDFLSSEETSNFSPEFLYRNLSNRGGQFYEKVPLIRVENNVTNCVENIVGQFQADFDSIKVFPKLGFHDSWIRRKWFWHAEDFDFEGRYQSRFKSTPAPPSIKVFVVPHSHSDPGWLKTFEGYFHSQTKHTLDLAVEKLMLYPNMTFVWNEISFLSLWWEGARQDQKMQMKQLIREGRLEILTGGWVMADEATVNLYSLVDELIEGRQWVLNRLGIVPTVSWSIDPFGHGAAMPYLLKSAGIDNMVIQRLHYAWKKYLGEKQYGNFEWVQRWDVGRESGIRVHNAPYDIYTTKHTCGPDPLVCLKLDFRNIIGEYSEYMRHARPVREIDLDALATELVGQLQRTASLSPSKVVMFPLGDDFRFDKSQEWDQQYENYVLIINHINSNYAKFRTDIRFGTVSDYFSALESENQKLPTFSGDFFPYSDAYVSGRPAYWTGFYGTRPYWKKFYRETESQMRTAEIMFTYVHNLAAHDPILSVVLKREYQNLVKARRHLALFAHHDGSTGTSRKTTMDDYGRKLMESTRSAIQIQRQSIRSILHNGLNISISSLGIDKQVLSFGEEAAKVPRIIYDNEAITKKVLVFNSLSFKKVELIKLRVNDPMVKIMGTNSQPIPSQINPVVEVVENQIVFSKVYELSFLTELDPLTLHTFEIRRAPENDPDLSQPARVSCRGCLALNDTLRSHSFEYFQVENITTPTIILGNGEQELYFNGSSGYLQRIVRLHQDISLPVQVQFGGYKSIFRESGAYLLKPDLESKVQIPFDSLSQAKLLIVEGPITSYLTSYNEPLTVTTRLLNKDGQGVRVENVVDLGTTPAEVYMRIDTWMNSTSVSQHGTREPTMITDQNGYTFEKRVKVPWIGYEGNVYPVNGMAFIQDLENEEMIRFSVLVDRSHGFNSMEYGRLETLIERRTLYDDGRGMSEGVTDNKRTTSNYIFLLEKLPQHLKNLEDYSLNLPTLNALHLSLGLNYVPNSFGYDDLVGSYLGRYSLLSKDMLVDSHLLNLRTLSNISQEEEHPTSRALLIVQKLGFLNLKTCEKRETNSSDLFAPNARFNGLDMEYGDITDLAGVVGVQHTGRRSTLPTVERKPFEITSLMISFKQRNAGGISRWGRNDRGNVNYQKA